VVLDADVAVVVDVDVIVVVIGFHWVAGLPHHVSAPSRLCVRSLTSHRKFHH
jgi:hypothetical protein